MTILTPIPIKMIPPKISAFGPRREEANRPMRNPMAEISAAVIQISRAEIKMFLNCDPVRRATLMSPKLKPEIRASMLRANPRSSVLRNESRSEVGAESLAGEQPSWIIFPPTNPNSTKAIQWS
mgnify:CR=1 FL=1